MSERDLTEDDVRREHLAAVSTPAHWAYLFGVIGGAFVLMVALLALLGSGA